MPRYMEKRNVPVRLDNDELLHAGEKLSKGTADLVDLQYELNLIERKENNQ